jgi:hypothetical protein
VRIEPRAGESFEVLGVVLDLNVPSGGTCSGYPRPNVTRCRSVTRLWMLEDGTDPGESPGRGRAWIGTEGLTFPVGK